MTRPDYVSDEHRTFGAGLAEAMKDPAHLCVTGFQCVDYGSRWDEVPRPELKPKRSWWRRLFARER